MPALGLVMAMMFNYEVIQFVSPLQATLAYIPYLLIIAGFLLAWGYNNGREVNLLFFIAITYWVVQNNIWLPGKPLTESNFIFASLCLIVSLNFLFQILLKERGLRIRQLLKRITLMCLVPALLWIFTTHSYQLVQQSLNVSLWNNLWPEHIHLPQLSIILVSLSLIYFLIKLVRNPNVLLAGSIMSYIALLIALNNINSTEMSMLYFSIACASLLIAIVFNSYNLAYLDELTGLPTRRALKQYLLSLEKDYSIAMLDIDHFKKLNDTYGHDIGDQALRMVSALLRQVNGGGKVFRYGGEEFIVVFANKEASETLDYLDELREKIANTVFSIRDLKRPKVKPTTPARKAAVKNIHITVSGGVSNRTAQHANTQEVIVSADKALYSAKHAGRNCIHSK